MFAVVIEPPNPFVSLAEAKRHLRVDGDDDDELIGVLLGAVCGLIDGPDGWLEHAVGEQTLELRIDAFSSDPIRLPCPPVVEITSVKYTDTEGAEQTVDDSLYRLTGQGTLNVYLELVDGASWPSAASIAEAVRITYEAGYETPPPGLKAAALLMLGDLYENRETAAVGMAASAIPMPATVEALVGKYRQVRV